MCVQKPMYHDAHVGFRGQLTELVPFFHYVGSGD